MCSYIPSELKVVKGNGWDDIKLKRVPKTRWGLILASESGAKISIPLTPSKAVALMKVAEYHEIGYREHRIKDNRLD